MFKKFVDRKSLRIAAILLTVAVLTTGVAFAVGGTLAASADTAVSFAQQPNDYTLVQKGAFNDRAINGGYRAESSDTSVADAAMQSGMLHVTGNKAGVVSVAVGSNVGIVHAYNYQVWDAALMESYVLKSGGEVYFSAPGSSKPNPLIASPASAQNTVVWSSLNTTIATVNSNGAITATGKGAAIVVGQFTDKWGAAQDVHVLVGVGVQLGQSDLSELLDLIQKGEAILSLNPNPYTTDTLSNLQNTVNNGKAVADSSNPSDKSVSDAIDGLNNAINNLKLKTVTPDGVVGPDGSGNWYRPLGDPKNIYEVVNEDGTSKTLPPSYVYSPSGDPTDGDNRPAYPNKGFYWAEDPAGGNIYKQVEGDGSLLDSPAVWGGPNGKFGDGDDQQVFKDADGTYWVNLGQNIWQQVETPTTLGPLTGGGPNGSPATAKVRPIVNVGNLYYAGPVGKDVDGNDYYYGDSLSNGNGKVDSTASVKDPTDDIFYLVDGQMSITPPAKPVTDTPSVATAGRILTPAQTGDTVNWVEIATNGDYSLIVRASYLNWNSNHKDAPEWQYVSFGATGAYTNSIVRGHINAWFGNTAAGSDVDNLSANAPLRNYTVMSNAKTVLGTDSSDSGGLSNGFSKPDPANPVRKADDVAFALSSCEIANFLSKEYTNGTSGGIAASSQAAIDNFGRITIPSIFGYGMWGRTPGAASNTAGALDNTGRVFRFDISNSANNKGLVYPALWVNSAIFSQ